MICDSHIHVGQFYDIYTSPRELVGFLDDVGVERFAVSSTTICEVNYEKVIGEIMELVQLAGNRVTPILWVLPQMYTDGGLERFLYCGIDWKCLKIHPQLHPNSWKTRGKNMKRLMKSAKEMELPVMIHTGEMECCHAGLFKALALRNLDIKFILAHGRPLDETVDVMQSCDNTFTDTAFMSTENVTELCKNGLADKVLWGTDYPIPKYYYRGDNMRQYYNALISNLKSKIEASDFEKITKINFNNIMNG